MVSFWWAMYQEVEVTPGQVFELLRQDDLLANVLGDGSDRSQLTRFGNALARMDGQVYGGYKIARCRDEKGQFRRDRKGSALYRLVPMEAAAGGAGTPGTEGSDAEPDGAEPVQGPATRPDWEQFVAAHSSGMRVFADQLQVG